MNRLSPDGVHITDIRTQVEEGALVRVGFGVAALCRPFSYLTRAGGDEVIGFAVDVVLDDLLPAGREPSLIPDNAYSYLELIGVHWTPSMGLRVSAPINVGGHREWPCPPVLVCGHRLILDTPARTGYPVTQPEWEDQAREHLSDSPAWEDLGSFLEPAATSLGTHVPAAKSQGKGGRR